MKKIECRFVYENSCIYDVILDSICKEVENNHGLGDKHIYYSLYSELKRTVGHICKCRKGTYEYPDSPADSFVLDKDLLEFKENFAKLLEYFPDYKDIEFENIRSLTPQMKSDLDYIGIGLII